MPWLIPPLLIALIILIAVILSHRSGSQQYRDPILKEEGRDYYLPYSTRLACDEHERNHYEQAMIARACALVEQRKSGRWLGQHVTVIWHPGLDDETDSQANWLIKHGEHCGVTVVRLGQ